MCEFFRPNLWPNTPDILTEYLQFGGRPAFVMRLVLAATLGASYGIYGPAFELMDNRPRETRRGGVSRLREVSGALAGTSTSPTSLRDLITRVNRIRRENPALQSDATLTFHALDNEAMIAYSKTSGEDSILVVVNVDPHHAQTGWVELDLAALGLPADTPYQMHDLLSGARFLWRGARNYVALDPGALRRTLPHPPQACAPSAISIIFCDMNSQPEPPPFTGDPLWYKDAVIYEVHVRAFYDSNDDGIGDFGGITRKLDYIQELGVNTIWLLPFYPSPGRDDGYDIADYHNIHPQYGTRREFRAFVREAHRRGLRVITELVINHTSDAASVVSGRAARTRRLCETGFLRVERRLPIAMPARASSSATRRAPTGAGIRSPTPTTGTASSATSPT